MSFGYTKVLCLAPKTSAKAYPPPGISFSLVELGFLSKGYSFFPFERTILSKWVILFRCLNVFRIWVLFVFGYGGEMWNIFPILKVNFTLKSLVTCQRRVFFRTLKKQFKIVSNSKNSAMLLQTIVLDFSN